MQVLKVKKACLKGGAIAVKDNKVFLYKNIKNAKRII